jgi:hypothetical protein
LIERKERIERERVRYARQGVIQKIYKPLSNNPLLREILGEGIRSVEHQKFRPGVGKEQQIGEMFYSILLNTLADLTFSFDLSEMIEIEKELGIKPPRSALDWDVTVCLPNIGSEADYKKAMEVVLRLGHRIFASQLPKFGKGVLMNRRPPDIILKKGRGMQIFSFVCTYIAAGWISWMYGTDPESMRKFLDSQSNDCPFLVCPASHWISSARCSSRTFYKYLNLLTKNDFEHIRNPVPIEPFTHSSYSKDGSPDYEFVKVNGKEYFHIPASVLEGVKYKGPILPLSKK